MVKLAANCTFRVGVIDFKAQNRLTFKNSTDTSIKQSNNKVVQSKLALTAMLFYV